MTAEELEAKDAQLQFSWKHGHLGKTVREPLLDALRRFELRSIAIHADGTLSFEDGDGTPS